MVVAAGALVGGFGTATVLGMVAYINADHVGVLDDPVVVDAADRACSDLRTQVDAASVPAGGSASDLAESIRTQDVAVQELVDVMSRLGHDRLAGDHPPLGWLDDWRTLIRLRETYARELLAGQNARLVVPRVDGVPITRRMTALADCDVVVELTKLP
ncbi:hypothetical protein GCM10027053_18650 [Intrasporangium mesophilum]